jgi:tetratricopeptide (TPR) repeat protein/cytochrome c5
MRSCHWFKRAVVVGVSVVTLVVSIAYFFTSRKLSYARQMRQDDDYGNAEETLAVCLRLPGLTHAIELEQQLLAVQQGDLRNEKELLARAANQASYAGLILEALAKGNLRTFKWIEVQERAESILKKDPNNARSLWLRGLSRIEMQQEALALDDLKRAFNIEPGIFEIRRSLAELLHKMGHVGEAIDHLVPLHSRRPDDERIVLALAHCWQDEALLEDACELVDSLISSRPESIAGLVERGRIGLRMNQLEAAERWLRRALELSPDHADARFVLGLALQSQNKSDVALNVRIRENEKQQADLKNRLHKSSRNPSTMTDVGQWMLRTGKEEEAVGWFYSALMEDSNFVPAHRGLAQYFLQAGQTRRSQWHSRLAGNEASFDAIRRPERVILPKIGRLAAPQSAGRLEGENEAVVEDVHRMCAACHAYPEPETMPRSVWRKEVKQGYNFLRDSSLAGEFPNLESVVRYYERRAPEQLPAIEQTHSSTGPPIKFEKRGTGWMPDLPPQPGITNANLTSLLGTMKQELVLCDSRLDALLVLKPYDGRPGGIVLPQVPAPCHTVACDLDRDGNQDMLVASLGSFFPTDDKVGSVLWLHAKSPGQFESIPILNGVGRVTDVQVADFNADGKLDLVVAIFGWRTGGEIVYLENQTTDWSNPKFATHTVDARHGAIHVPVADLNCDGKPDFVALISQEHETIVAYMSQGDGTFYQETIFTAAHPTYGCSGIEIVDLDGDRDLDVLLTNGDILDPPYLLKPYHGIQWLENEGRFPFKHNHLAAMHGVSRAVAADFDGDGDQDVAAVSFLPVMHFPEREKLRLPSVVLLEQKSKLHFKMHILETSTCDHFSCAVGDWDNDGLTDLVVPNFSWNGSKPISDAAVLWRNTGAPK